MTYGFDLGGYTRAVTTDSHEARLYGFNLDYLASHKSELKAA